MLFAEWELELRGAYSALFRVTSLSQLDYKLDPIGAGRASRAGHGSKLSGW